MKAAVFWALCAALVAAGAGQRFGNPYEGNADAVRAGAKLFAQHCAQCHGRSAEGIGQAPSLRSKKVQDKPPETLFETITNGRMRSGMPTWAQLPAEQRWQIVTYLRSLK